LSIARKRLVPLFCWNMAPIQTLRISMATLLSIMLCIVRPPHWQKYCFSMVQILRHWTRYRSINFLSKIFVLTFT
ncbi:ANKRD20A2 isoform 2, partial [Pongo abelii]